MLGRRGPAQASFTTQELRELDELAGATVLVDPADLELDPGAEERAAADRNVTRNLAVLRGWADHAPDPGRTRLRLRFFAPAGAGARRGPGDRRRGGAHGRGRRRPRRWAPASWTCCRPTSSSARWATAACRCRGCRSTSAPGRCRTRTGGCCATGGPRPASTWRAGSSAGPAASSAPTSTTPARPSRRCSPTPPTGTLPAQGPVGDLVDELVSRGAEPVLIDDWRAIDAAEVALGATRGRARTTLHEREALLAAVRAATQAR